MPKPATCRYSVGQTVEVLVRDFSLAGYPLVWTLGQVTKVEATGSAGRWNVIVQTGPAAWSPQIVGARGGNANIREV